MSSSKTAVTTSWWPNFKWRILVEIRFSLNCILIGRKLISFKIAKICLCVFWDILVVAWIVIAVNFNFTSDFKKFFFVHRIFFITGCRLISVIWWQNNDRTRNLLFFAVIQQWPVIIKLDSFWWSFIRCIAAVLLPLDGLPSLELAWKGRDFNYDSECDGTLISSQCK